MLCTGVRVQISTQGGATPGEGGAGGPGTEGTWGEGPEGEGAERIWPGEGPRRSGGPRGDGTRWGGVPRVEADRGLRGIPLRGEPELGAPEGG